MRTRLIFAAVFTAICLPLMMASADPVLLQTLSAQTMLQGYEPVASVRAVDIDWPLDADADGLARRDALRVGFRLPAPTEAEKAADVDPWLQNLTATTFRILLADADGNPPLEIGPNQIQNVRMLLTESGSLQLLEINSAAEESSLNAAGEALPSTQMGSRWALIPPLLAILLAFLLRGTLLALSAGVLVGAAMLAWAEGSLIYTLRIAFGDILIGEILTDPFHLYILGFVLLLSATVAVITRMGGIDGMVKALLRYAKNSRSVQAIAYALGLGIFFDDYANTIIVGNSCGPLFDRMKVSRAKLAYIVDSTAAPVAGIAILSTWVAYQISTYAPQLPTVGIPASQGYALFLETVPYRFYCLFAMFMVGCVIWTKRDIGPMRRMEEQARDGKDESLIGAGDGPAAHTLALPGVPARWFNGVLPLALMIFGTAGLIYALGAATMNEAITNNDSEAIAASAEGGFVWMRAVLGASDSTKAIFYGSLAAFVLAVLMAIGQRLLSAGEITRTASNGIRILFKDAVLILLLAWSIGKVCGHLGTATYLVAAFQGIIDGAWLPIILFLASCFVAFATGSSWTTMAIMQPNVVLLAYHLGENTPYGPHGLLVLSIGAVLEGAIFGDHCSPISDTTILSSAASKCNHITHVRTQAPYAIATAFVAVLFGYIPTAIFNTPFWVSILAGFAVLYAFMRFAGKPTEKPQAVS
ncbi:MAG: Na+/H+ antiporter NhaC family protein [Planctomycetes bacterium]|nr:Na+/H+ antiporter NhaC family protein [Planctomycetota bacterium]